MAQRTGPPRVGDYPMANAGGTPGGVGRSPQQSAFVAVSEKLRACTHPGQRGDSLSPDHHRPGQKTAATGVGKAW